jgi:hypothetical protein
MLKFSETKPEQFDEDFFLSAARIIDDLRAAEQYFKSWLTSHGNKQTHYFSAFMYYKSLNHFDNAYIYFSEFFRSTMGKRIEDDFDAISLFGYIHERGRSDLFERFCHEFIPTVKNVYGARRVNKLIESLHFLNKTEIGRLKKVK